MAWVVVALPPAPLGYMKGYQPALEAVFGNAWRIALGSMIAFWCGSFVNSYVLAKMKIWTAGRWLWTRTIGSTHGRRAGRLGLFYVHRLLRHLGNRRCRQGRDGAVRAQDRLGDRDDAGHLQDRRRSLKRAEHEDYYDRNTNFTPFSLRT